MERNLFDSSQLSQSEHNFLYNKLTSPLIHNIDANLDGRRPLLSSKSSSSEIDTHTFILVIKIPLDSTYMSSGICLATYIHIQHTVSQHLTSKTLKTKSLLVL